MLVYLNGKFIPLENAVVSVSDYGFLFGYAVFETMHAYNGTVFRLNDHVSRIMSSLNTLEIPMQPEDLVKAVNETIKTNKLLEARIRLTVSSGPGSSVTDLSSCKQPTAVIIALPYTRMPTETYEKGFALSTAKIRRNSQSSVQGIKKTDYLESILARREARRAGADDALFLNDKGYVAEGSTNNIFMIKNNILKTPSLASGILPGITRDVVLEIAPRTGLDAREAEILPEELMFADEVFLTSSMMEIMPVTRMDTKTIGNGRPGAVTIKLAAAYKNLVKEETSQN